MTLDMVKEMIPAVPLRGGVVFPGITTTISIGRPRSLAAAKVAHRQEGEILILVQYDPEVENPGREDLAPIGVLANVRDLLRTSQLGVQMLVEMRHRVQIDELDTDDPYLKASYKAIEGATDAAAPELMAEAIAYVEQYIETLGEVNRQVMATLRGKETAGELADFLAGLLNMPLELELDLLTSLHGVERLAKVRDYLEQELRI
ncbi:MAG: LON peptidase substrate-binding domain-containing protein, partial [Candidatus Promineifilaceae bacterium]